MNEPSTPLTFDPNRKAYAFGRRFLVAAVGVSVAVVFTTLSAYSQTAQSDVVSEAGVPVEQTVAAMGPNFTPASFNQNVIVMVELQDEPAAKVYAASLNDSYSKSGGGLSRMSPVQKAVATNIAVSQAKGQLAKIESAHTAILPKVSSMALDGKILFRTKSAYNGISVNVPRSKIAELSALPGVKAVHIQIPKFQTAPTDIDFLGGRTPWTTITGNAPFGNHGENIKVGVIDSGLDYVHTNFGGPGTPAAYATIQDTVAPNAFFPSSKVPGGYDFVGDAYTGSNTPMPDPNPFDDSIIGHGTACASLIAGLGVTASGGTYVGLYDNSTNIAGLKISPGFAPKALIYPLRVFGVTGSTGVVTQAIDWAVDPNGDGNISDHLDVISMSLGANTGSADDPDDIAATNASIAGVIVCSAAGNAGDSYYIVSSPSVARGTLSVAATFNNTAGFFYDSNVTANSPAAIAGQKYFSLYGSPSPTVPASGLTNDIVWGNPSDGSAPLTNAAAVAGKICLMDRGNAISFVQKATVAQNAGAVACIIVNNVAGVPIVPGLDSTITKPTVMISQADGATIKGQLDPVTRTGVNVTMNNDNGFLGLGAPATDTLPTYSARGPRLGDSALKPDISAPAEVVGVANNLTGSDVMSFNGTSSATPHVAGMMILLRQLHPTWTVQELNALAMNTATHDEFTGVGGTGFQYGTGRVGAGRIDIAKASTASVVAYNQTDFGTTNVSFGIVEVPVDSSATQSKSITVSNKSAVDVTYNVSYQDVTPVAGATLTVGTGSQVTVPAGGTASVPVSFFAIGSLLKHAREASVVANLPSARAWLTEKTGYAVFTPTGGVEPTIRVALYASCKPVSSMHASPTFVVPGAATGTFTLNLTGVPINTGATFNANPQDIISLAKPFELQYFRTASTNPPTDPNIIKNVGVTSDFPLRGSSPQNTVLTFAVEGFGNASTPDFFSSDKEIFISTDGVSFNYAMVLSSAANGTSNSNAYFPVVINLGTGAGFTQVRTNLLSPTGSGTSRDTNLFNNSAVLFSVVAGNIGLAGPGQPTKFLYEVATFDRNGNLVDLSGVLTYDMANPGLNVQGGNLDPFYYNDLPTTIVPVSYNTANYQNNGSLGLLMVHMHNGTGNRTEAVTFGAPIVTSFSPDRGPIGTQVQITGNNFGAGSTVTFYNNKPATSVIVVSSTTILATVPTGTQTGPITVSNAAGSSTLKEKFVVAPHNIK